MNSLVKGWMEWVDSTRRDGGGGNEENENAAQAQALCRRAPSNL